MDEIKDILLEGEKVLWSGKPDLSLAKPPTPYWRRKMVHLGWLLITAAVVAVCLWASRAFSVISLVFNTIAVIGIVGLIPGILAFFDFKDSAEDPSKHHYTLTNYRLIALLEDYRVKKELFPNSVIAIEAYTEQSPKRLNIFYGQSENEFVSLVGLTDVEHVQKLITETLALRSKNP